jgi:hypothetical protein
MNIKNNNNYTGISIQQVLELDKELMYGKSENIKIKFLEAEANCDLLGYSEIKMKHFKTPTIGQLEYARRRMKRMQIKLEHNIAKLNRKILEIRLQHKASTMRKKEYEQFELTNLLEIDIISDYDISDL